MEKFVFPQSMGYIHKTVNVPRELYDEVNRILKGRKTTFSEFAVAAMEFTLKNIETKEGV